MNRHTRLERSIQIDKFELYKPFVFYTLVVFFLNTAAVTRGDLRFTTIGLLIGSGLITWGLIEYATHRWVLHSKPKASGLNLPGNLTHLKHHADPQSLRRLNVQLSESVPICIVYYLCAWAITGRWEAATYLFTGLIAGYFFYEYLDFQAHHGSSQTRFVRYFRMYHLLHHHFNASVRYGVTTPLFDYLFGTFHIKKRSVEPAGRLRNNANRSAAVNECR